MAESLLIMPFGKHKGEPVEDVPYSYLRWLLDQEWFVDEYEDESELVAEEMAYRDKWGKR